MLRAAQHWRRQYLEPLSSHSFALLLAGCRVDGMHSADVSPSPAPSGSEQPMCLVWAAARCRAPKVLHTTVQFQGWKTRLLARGSRQLQQSLLHASGDRIKCCWCGQPLDHAAVDCPQRCVKRDGSSRHKFRRKCGSSCKTADKLPLKVL